MKLEKVIFSAGMLGVLGLMTTACGSSASNTTTSSVSSQSTSTSQPQINANSESGSTDTTSQSASSQQTSSSIQSSNQDSEKSSSQSTSEDTNISPETVGVLVALYKEPDWFKAGVKGGSMYYGDNYKFGKETKGYNFITAKGDPTSYIYYKQNGDNITIKYVDPKEGETVAEASITSKDISLKRLIGDYYTTKDQQAEVDDYVSQLKPYED